MPFGNYHNVTGAGWSVYWRIPKFDGSGLEVWWADFQGRRVMWRGSAPFAIVPYHNPNTNGEPPGPHFSYKDGIDTQCGGAPFRALKHGAPNSGAPWQSSAFDAADDTEAVVVTVTPADDFEPARLAITAKFQCGWYQYVHSWEFDSYGAIHPRVAMGGMLNPNCPTKSHFHNFYFRIDLDIDGQFPHDVCEVFTHNTLNDPGGDKWDPVLNQGKLLANSASARKWRVRNTVSKNRAGEFKAYEIELPQLSGHTPFSTGDVWVTTYRGDSVQQGEGVGAANCSDKELESTYAVGALHPGTTGDDIVLWVVIRAHHEPRFKGEEANFLPYHYEEYSIVPRSFAELGQHQRGPG
jgi:Cu2+-containing amine oxidase